MKGGLDFAYPEWLTCGPPVVTVAVLPLLILAIARRWSPLLLLLIGAVTLWLLAAFTVTRFVLNGNGRASLPTQSFLSSGAGRVLDIGAGTGGSPVKALDARPHATVVTLDLFGEFRAKPPVAGMADRADFHLGTRGPALWTKHVEDAGMRVAQQGRQPATLHVPARK